MTAAYSYNERKKAGLFTLVICVFLLLLFFIIKWNNLPATTPLIADEMLINLGNEAEGWGEEQPLTKGEPAPVDDAANRPAPAEQQQSVTPPAEDNNEDAAAVTPAKQPVKSTPDKPAATTTEKNQPVKQVPKLTYPGNNNTNPGNNKTEDNDFKNQGKDKNKDGDKGAVNGEKDSYGQNNSGSIGGIDIKSGNRKIKTVRPYKFNGNLKKGIVFAIVMVDPLSLIHI